MRCKRFGLWTSAVAVLSLAAAGCGEAEEPPPSGEPEPVVHAAPEEEPDGAPWWEGHTGDVEWQFGIAPGLALAEQMGKPAMIFYTGDG